MVPIHTMSVTDTEKLYTEGQFDIYHSHVLIGLGLLAIRPCLSLHCVTNPRLFEERL